MRLAPRAAGWTLVVLSLAVFAGPAQAEGRLQAYGRLRQEADKAIQAGDPALAEARLTEAATLFPNHPGMLVRLAEARAQRGETAAAVAALDHLAREGLTFDVAADAKLASLAAAPALAPVKARFELNAAPIGSLTRTRDVSGAGRPVEGVAIDTRTGRVLLSAVGGRQLLALDAEGATRPFGGAEAMGGLFGIAADGPRRRLWAAEASGPDIPGSGARPAETALVCFDLDSGRLIRRYPLAEPGGHQLNDVVLGPGGSVFVSDAAGGGVYRLRPNGEALERVGATDQIASAQGMALADEGRALVVADYSSGLHRIDLATGVDEPIGEPDGFTLTGIDGVAADGADLIVTQNGSLPQRVVRLTLAPDARSVRSAQVLLANPRLAAGEADLTLGAVTGTGEARAYVFVARSGWADVGDKGEMTSRAATAPATIGWLSLAR